MECDVEKAVMVSTDKACSPVNTYGENSSFINKIRYVWSYYHPKKITIYGDYYLILRIYMTFTSSLLFCGNELIVKFKKIIKERKICEDEVIFLSLFVGLAYSILTATDIDRMIISFYPLFIFLIIEFLQRNDRKHNIKKNYILFSRLLLVTWISSLFLLFSQLITTEFSIVPIITCGIGIYYIIELIAGLSYLVFSSFFHSSHLLFIKYEKVCQI